MLILAGLAALLATVPASAAAPGDRATAAAFRQATIDLHFTVTQQAPAIAAALETLDDPACAKAIRHLPEDQLEETLLGYLLPAVLELEFDPLKRSFAAFSARLDTIEVRDPELRGGRTAWRELAAAFARMPPGPADFCARLDAWRKAGYPAASRPVIHDPVLEDLLSDDDGRLAMNLEKIARASRHLQELGVSKRVADWWTLDTLLDDAEPRELELVRPS
jgi:hypothetical protein